MQKWGVFKSTFGGRIIRCPLGQLTVRPPKSQGLSSERLGFVKTQITIFGWRLVWRRLGIG